MKGLVRRIDELGRVTLPKEYRDAMKLRYGDCISMAMTSSGTITLRSTKTICVFCGRETTGMLAEHPCCGRCRAKVAEELNA